MNGKPFEEYEVEADSVEDFLDRYYKPQRFRERGDEYAKVVIASHKERLASIGYDIISKHDSMTGRPVCYRPQVDP